MRLRDHRGQSSLEYVGMLLIIGVFILALANTRLGSWLETTVKTASCRIGGGQCAGTATAAGGALGTLQRSHLDPTAPHSGPPIGNGLPVGGLPFPGSASFTVDGDPFPGEADPVTGDSKKSPVKVSGKFTDSRSSCTEDADGHPQVTLSADVQIQVEAGGKTGGEEEKKGVEVGGSIFAGHTTQYQVTTDPGRADAISRGKAPPPNPKDPSSIPTNGSIVLNQQSYAGAKGTVVYHNIMAELQYKKGHQVSSGVTRLDGHHVRITVGDSRLVENSLGLSVGSGDVNAGVSLSRGVSDGKTRSVDIDISTEQGWNAYQQFIETGKLPPDGAAGTANPLTSRVMNFSSTDQAKVHVGPIDLGFGGSHLDGQVALTTRPDGSQHGWLIDNRGSTQFVQTYDRRLDGSYTNERYAIRLQNPDPSEVDGYNQFSGSHVPTKGRDLTFTFTPAQLQAMQDAAADQVLAASKRFHTGPFKNGGTRAQVRQYLSDHPYGDGLPNVGGPAYNSAVMAMAGARDVSGVARGLFNAGAGSASGALEFLLTFSATTKGARHELGMPLGKDAIRIPSQSNRPKGC